MDRKKIILPSVEEDSRIAAVRRQVCEQKGVSPDEIKEIKIDEIGVAHVRLGPKAKIEKIEFVEFYFLQGEEDR